MFVIKLVFLNLINMFIDRCSYYLDITIHIDMTIETSCFRKPIQYETRIEYTFGSTLHNSIYNLFPGL